MISDSNGSRDIQYEKNVKLQQSTRPRYQHPAARAHQRLHCQATRPNSRYRGEPGVSPALTPLVTTSAPPVQLNNRDWESLSTQAMVLCNMHTQHSTLSQKSHRRVPLAPSPDSAHRGVSGVHATSTTLPVTSIVPSTLCRVLYEQKWLLPHTLSNGKNLLYRDKHMFFTE